MQNRFITFVSILFVGLASATPVWAGKANLWAEGNDYVRLAPVDAVNQHPTLFSPEQLTTLLGNFYKRERNKDPVPYFSQDEIGRLAGQLVPLFAKAKPGDDIEFGTSYRPGEFYLVPRVLNAGRLFVENGQLNLLIGMCAEEQNIGYQQAFGSSRPLSHGSRTAPVEKLKCALQAAGAAERVNNRTDWLRLNINAALSAPAAPVVPTTTPLSFGGAAPATAQPPAAAPVSAAKPTVSAAPVAPAAPASQAEERLLLLKRLHDKGLITDTEYEQARTAIVKSL